MIRDIDVLIVGAGPAGLSTAYHLQREHMLWEKEDEVGGLCRSIEWGGGVFDIGGHSFHTPHPDVRALVESLMGENWEYQERDARVYSHGALIPYPFQKSFEQIPDPEVVEQCRRGLEQATGVDAADNFEDYLVGRFGAGIAEHFMLPYNRKLWARDIKKISCEWTAERVAAPKGASEAFRTSGGQRKPLQSNTQVGYPAEGGFQEIFKAFVPRMETLRTGTELVRIDPVSRTAYAANGESVHWRQLVSTLPVTRLIDLIDDTPDHLIRDAATLEAMSLHLLLLLVGRPLPEAPHRVYVADPAVPPHKIAFNHTSSSSLRAKPVHAIMAEISYSDEKPLGDPADVRDRTIGFLVEAGIIGEEHDVVDSRVIDVPHAYPVYTHERPATMEAIKGWLRTIGIETLGRFGEWEYVNSDKCLKMGMDMAATLDRSDVEF